MAGLKPLRTVCGVLVLLSGEIREQSILKATFCWYAKHQASAHCMQHARICLRLLDPLPIVIHFVAMLQAGQMIQHRLQASHHSIIFPVSWFVACAVPESVRSVGHFTLMLQLPEPKLTRNLLSRHRSSTSTGQDGSSLWQPARQAYMPPITP